MMTTCVCLLLSNDSFCYTNSCKVFDRGNGQHNRFLKFESGFGVDSAIPRRSFGAFPAKAWSVGGWQQNRGFKIGGHGADMRAKFHIMRGVVKMSTQRRPNVIVRTPRIGRPAQSGMRVSKRIPQDGGGER